MLHTEYKCCICSFADAQMSFNSVKGFSTPFEISQSTCWPSFESSLEKKELSPQQQICFADSQVVFPPFSKDLKQKWFL